MSDAKTFWGKQTHRQLRNIIKKMSLDENPMELTKPQCIKTLVEANISPNSDESGDDDEVKNDSTGSVELIPKPPPKKRTSKPQKSRTSKSAKIRKSKSEKGRPSKKKRKSSEVGVVDVPIKRFKTRSTATVVDAHYAMEKPGDVLKWLDHEFQDIVGQHAVKEQLRVFVSKTRVNKVKEKMGMVRRNKLPPLHHMVFRGPPGTGKTTIATIVAKILHKLGITKNDKVEIVPNPLAWKGTHCGETVPKVVKSIKNAEGGVLFVDEAYFLLQAKDKFGEEILGTLMQHMLPPTCVMMFAGYTKKMEKFMTANAGLKSRTPYIFTFEDYSIEELVAIFRVFCRKGNEKCLASDAHIASLLSMIDIKVRKEYNGRLAERVFEFAVEKRDLRLCRECPDEKSLIASSHKLVELQTIDIDNGVRKFYQTVSLEVNEKKEASFGEKEEKMFLNGEKGTGLSARLPSPAKPSNSTQTILVDLETNTQSRYIPIPPPPPPPQSLMRILTSDEESDRKSADSESSSSSSSSSGSSSGGGYSGGSTSGSTFEASSSSSSDSDYYQTEEY